MFKKADYDVTAYYGKSHFDSRMALNMTQMGHWGRIGRGWGLGGGGGGGCGGSGGGGGGGGE
mgnify:CR=1 FL=1